jgi:hypothetical protein
MSYEILTGKRFGRLFVTGYGGKNKWGNVVWNCNCDCGGTKIVPTSSLKSGYTKSCGCIGKEKPSHFKHGGKGTRLYHIWKSMNSRCNTSSCPSYVNYGARGISVCEEWRDYKKFKNWSLSNGYLSNLSIDRINNDGNYSPDNCRWATPVRQARNKRNTLYYTYEGVKKPLADWADHYNINYKQAWQKLKNGLCPITNKVIGL